MEGGGNLIPGSLDDALRQKPKSIEFLEDVRMDYLRDIEKASGNRVKLLNLLEFFTIKEAVTMSHVRQLEDALRYMKEPLRTYVEKELLPHKRRMVLLWRGLREEVEKRI